MASESEKALHHHLQLQLFKSSEVISKETKHTEKKSAKKVPKDPQRSRSDSESSSVKNQATAVTDTQSGTSSSATTESNKSSQATPDTQSDSPVPSALVGTWTGTSPQATDISFTVDADENITSKENFNVTYEPYCQSFTTAKAVQISGNLYV